MGIFCGDGHECLYPIEAIWPVSVARGDYLLFLVCGGLGNFGYGLVGNIHRAAFWVVGLPGE